MIGCVEKSEGSSRAHQSQSVMKLMFQRCINNARGVKTVSTTYKSVSPIRMHLLSSSQAQGSEPKEEKKTQCKKTVEMYSS